MKKFPKNFKIHSGLLSLVLSFFLISYFYLSITSLSFATGSDFTVSSVCYNTSTNVLTFHISALPLTYDTVHNVALADDSSHAFYAVNPTSDVGQTVDTTDYSYTFGSNSLPGSGNVDVALETPTATVVYSQPVSIASLNCSSPTPTPTATPTPTPAVQIVADPSSSSVTVGTPFNVDVKVTDTGAAFNAAQATVTASSNLSVTGIHAPTSNACNLQYTKHPTPSNPSFAGAIFGGSSTGCTVYTMTLTPTSTGTGTITFTNESIRSYSDNSEILTGVQNGSFTIADGPTPTPTAGVPQLTITSPFLTYLTSYTLAGGKDTAISHVFVNSSETGVTFPTSTTWQKPETLSLGDNNFTIYGTDDSSNQTATQTINVSRHTLGDINGDGNVDMIDASLFAVDFGKTSNLTYILSDMNGDGSVDLSDLSILAKLE